MGSQARSIPPSPSSPMPSTLPGPSPSVTGKPLFKLVGFRFRKTNNVNAIIYVFKNIGSVRAYGPAFYIGGYSSGDLLNLKELSDAWAPVEQIMRNERVGPAISGPAIQPGADIEQSGNAELTDDEVSDIVSGSIVLYLFAKAAYYSEENPKDVERYVVTDSCLYTNGDISHLKTCPRYDSSRKN